MPKYSQLVATLSDAEEREARAAGNLKFEKTFCATSFLVAALDLEQTQYVFADSSPSRSTPAGCVCESLLHQLARILPLPNATRYASSVASFATTLRTFGPCRSSTCPR